MSDYTKAALAVILALARQPYNVAPPTPPPAPAIVAMEAAARRYCTLMYSDHRRAHPTILRLEMPPDMAKLLDTEHRRACLPFLPAL